MIPPQTPIIYTYLSLPVRRWSERLGRVRRLSDLIAGEGGLPFPLGDFVVGVRTLSEIEREIGQIIEPAQIVHDLGRVSEVRVQDQGLHHRVHDGRH